MIFNQLLFLLLFIFNKIILSYIWIFPLYFSSNKYSKVKNIKSIYIDIALFYFYNILNAQFYMNVESKKYIINKDIDKVDIVIANHVGTIDFLYVMAILKQFNIDNYNFTFKSSIRNMLGIGVIVYVDTDILINLNWDTDKISIAKQINKINPNGKKEIIIIFPEGGRITEEDLINSQKYSKENNLPYFDYLQFPKSKGLWTIINCLANNNRLGKLWDMTFIRPNNLTQGTFVNDIIKKPLGNIYIDLRELDIPSNYKDIDKFKLWLYKEWLIKNDIIKNYKSLIYNKLEYNIKLSKEAIFIYLFGLILFILMLFNKYGRRYLIFIILLSYIIMSYNQKIK